MLKKLIFAAVAVTVIVIIGGVIYLVIWSRQEDETVPYRILHQDRIVNADLWSDQPEILSAGFGFDGIIGVDGGEAEVRAAGGTWNTITCTNGEEPDRRVLTSSSQTKGMTNGFDATAKNADGLPVVFSYPVLPSTIDHTDFRVTLNTGDVLTPDAAGIVPNLEYNERHVVVIFGDFGNRLRPDEDGTIYPILVEIVPDSTPLMLVGPDGLVSAVGLFKVNDHTPYEPNYGPTLVAAKLNRMSTKGEGAPRLFSQNLPNDGRALYGAEAQYRLRMYTSGGFSPDGVTGVRPDEFSRYFRLHVQLASGETLMLTETGVDYEVDGGIIRVVGLADLGEKADGENIVYDDCYLEDHDNYIDIILAGDEAAMRQITYLEIPAAGEYDPFYNPGGPGNNPSPDVRYTAPGLRDLEPVIIALDDPLTVTYED